SFIKEYRRMILIEFAEDFFGVKEYDIEKIIKDNTNIEFKYLNLNQRQSLLFINNIGLEYRDIKEAAYSIYNTIRMNCMSECFVSAGKKIEKAEDILGAYGRIELLIEKRFYNNSDEHIFIDDEFNEKVISSKNDTDIILKKIKQDMSIKDTESLKENFKKLCDLYENDNDISNMYVKFIFSNVLKDLYENLNEVSEKGFKEDINKIYKSSDFASVVRIINEYIVRFEESISDNPLLVHKEIETIKKYIYENYDKDIGVEVLAAQVCFAPSYLSYIFKKETGQNLSKFIKSYRMIKAKEMLETTYEKIVNVSYAVGYRNVSYFCQSFREYFGVSPQKFRNEGE
ncbi:MAG: helix-turn-helix transcriptional regulator, partial [Clostridium butyricum]